MEKSKKALFEPISQGRFHAKNRFIRAATKEELCDRDGHITDELYEIYRKLAAGGVGTIIVSSARVKLFDGTAHGGLLRLDNPAVMEDYKHLAALGKEYGTTMLIQATYTHKDIDAMTAADLDSVVEEFVDAALFAQEAGFDGIEIHEAHTVFMSYFLSPVYNHRTDEYGTNKALLGERVIKAVRERVRDDFIIVTKVNSDDFMEGGLTAEDSMRYCIEKAKLGLDAIEVSGNDPLHHVRSTEEESYFREFAINLRKQIGIPVMLVGGNRSLEVMSKLHQEGIDLFSMSRALTCEPDLVARWESGDEAPAKCRFCNACMNTHAHGCIFNIQKKS
jgi:2,4-dienoyl-CoA reductase-like NADH-dependent reductase (Old Yellow Enzyme family)